MVCWVGNAWRGVFANWFVALPCLRFGPCCVKLLELSPIGHFRLYGKGFPNAEA